MAYDKNDCLPENGGCQLSWQGFLVALVVVGVFVWLMS